MGCLGEAIPGDVRPLWSTEEGALPPRGPEDELGGRAVRGSTITRRKESKESHAQRLLPSPKTLVMLTETTLPSA